MSSGGRAPDWLSASRTVCVPKGACHTDAQAVVWKAGELRLLTLMTIVAKIVARQADHSLAAIAARSLAGPQHVFLAGRSIVENIIELEGAFVQLSCVRHDAALLLLNFRAALDRRFMFAVLCELGVPRDLVGLVEALHATISISWEEVAMMRIASGSRQGRPLNCHYARPIGETGSCVRHSCRLQPLRRCR